MSEVSREKCILGRNFTPTLDGNFLKLWYRLYFVEVKSLVFHAFRSRTQFYCAAVTALQPFGSFSVLLVHCAAETSTGILCCRILVSCLNHYPETGYLD
jgi:hypothetical protein